MKWNENANVRYVTIENLKGQITGKIYSNLKISI